ncbi:MAG: HAD-IIIA family hydrolase [Planctomycetota bacterium]
MSSSADAQIATSIRGILSDVDGVLSDGLITYDAAGNETKSFHARDGLGIKLWMQEGLHFGIITARQSEIVSRRAQELGISDVDQGQRDKWAAAKSRIESWGLRPQEVAYIGDDLPDLVVMRRIGLAVAPADAAADVCAAADWVLQTPGGRGAVRELIERLMRSCQVWEPHVRAFNSPSSPRLPGTDETRC